MPQPLKDIEERLDLLKMTLGMFAPSEPGPVAAEILQLGEEILEHALIALRETPPIAAGGDRLLTLHAQCQRADAGFAALREACDTLRERHNLVTAAPDDPGAGAHLQTAVAAAADLCSFVMGRVNRSGLSGDST